MPRLEFPETFFFGASTAAYQIEGAAQEDGRKDCIWDTFTRDGHIADGSNAWVACDHYHRWAEDLDLMARANFNAYRFSLAWPRIIPEGTGAINQRGLDFYDRLIDGLLAMKIRPMICLYHWDLPQPLQDMGGWQSRDIVEPFVRYAETAAERFADRVTDWYMLNEPNVVAVNGYGTADHAPGLKLGETGVLRAMHNQNLAQGAALHALRAAHPKLKLGTVVNNSPCRPEDPSKPEDVAAAARWDAVWNRVALDGLFKGEMPKLLEPWLDDIVEADDMKTIQFPVDSFGINYYSRATIKHEEGHLFNCWWGDTFLGRDAQRNYTAMGWPVEPEGLYEQLVEFRDRYGNPSVFIAENGACYEDVVNADGTIHDTERTTFIHDHIVQVHRALKAGCNVNGYLAWSLLDNFEWAAGLEKRFGIIRVNYKDCTRTPKDSYALMASIAKDRAVITGD